MNDLQLQQKRWLIDQLAKKGRGARGLLAEHLRIRQDAITRITNLKGGKEARDISIEELHGIADFFGSDPPGLIRKAAEKQPKSIKGVQPVPLLDSVAAGKLRAPSSQIPVEDVPLLAFADLGRGEFFALTVQGDSMDRVSPDGSVIVVNQADRTLVSGKAYVISQRGEATFKLWRSDPPRFSPYSTNPAHEPIFVKSKVDAEKMVVGRVKRTVLDL